MVYINYGASQSSICSLFRSLCKPRLSERSAAGVCGLPYFVSSTEYTSIPLSAKDALLLYLFICKSQIIADVVRLHGPSRLQLYTLMSLGSCFTVDFCVWSCRYKSCRYSSDMHTYIPAVHGNGMTDAGWEGWEVTSSLVACSQCVYS